MNRKINTLFPLAIRNSIAICDRWIHRGDFQVFLQSFYVHIVLQDVLVKGPVKREVFRVWEGNEFEGCHKMDK